MTLPPQSLLLVPEATVAAVQASFPKGNLYVEFRAEFGPLYDDQRFADLYPPSPGALWKSRPGAWRRCSVSA
jgi:hypothetical protein